MSYLSETKVEREIFASAASTNFNGGFQRA